MVIDHEEIKGAIPQKSMIPPFTSAMNPPRHEVQQVGSSDEAYHRRASEDSDSMAMTEAQKSFQAAATPGEPSPKALRAAMEVPTAAPTSHAVATKPYTAVSAARAKRPLPSHRRRRHGGPRPLRRRRRRQQGECRVDVRHGMGLGESVKP
ncbi:hypothetical protein OsI_29258 [Oryza sativa Indica Group]|uniref:Uncharacterized protein n=1 Tax=Oryza sativa subsp. indica TaxID=39946 RepID=A2YV98_ORYSI|nr:hypothetical protein OsI_29258 [Oryza sativa Indica Group]